VTVKLTKPPAAADIVVVTQTWAATAASVVIDETEPALKPYLINYLDFDLNFGSFLYFSLCR
jgi:hypothetical protein